MTSRKNDDTKILTRLFKALLILTVFINITFPKAGFYLNSLPVTVGYILLALSGICAVFAILARYVLVSRTLIIQLVLVGIFAIFNLPALVVSKTEPSVTTAYLLSISAVPVLAILVGHTFFQLLGFRCLISILRLSALLIVLIGLASFIIVNVGDRPDLIGIPYVTFTGGDFESVLGKHIDRGDVYKAISTYNNGNILGINLLIWFPLATIYLRPSGLVWLLRVLLFFTLSRTVWLGWLLSEWLAFTVRSRGWHKYVTGTLIVLFGVGVVMLASLIFRGSLNFLFDPTLGGRADQINFEVGLVNFDFIGIGEIVYASILRNLGLLGLVLFTLVWAFPLIRVYLMPMKPILAISSGLVTYLFLMLSDGAFYLIPTQFVFWFFAGILFSERSHFSRGLC